MSERVETVVTTTTNLLQLGTNLRGLSATYRIVSKRGEGGFGITYQAEREGDRKKVLVKELRFDRLSEWKSLELFTREAKTLASLNHPNIPAYYEFFAYDGERSVPPSEVESAQNIKQFSLILVQDFIEGDSLAEHITQGKRLTQELALQITKTLLQVLDYLHTLNPAVIHRDINPKNIILRPDGVPFLVDFGAIQESLRQSSKLGSTNVGTFGYMALEQMMGRATAATDLYALGMTLVATMTHLLPNELPVDESTGKVKISERLLSLPPEMMAALDAMLEPIVAKRAQSAREVLSILEGKIRPIQAHTKLVESTPMPTRKNSLVFTIPMYLGLAVAVLLNLILHSSLSESELVEMSVLWFFPLVFGLWGKFFESYTTTPSPISRALLFTFFSGLGLWFFFEAIFPSL